MYPETPPSTKSWLKVKLQTIKRMIGFPFSDEVLISILVCLISRDKHLILICKEENMEELRNMTEQIFQIAFGLTCSTINCEESQTIAEFTSNLFINKTRDENSYLLPSDSPEETAIFRVKTQKSSRSLKTVDSNRSNDKKFIMTSTAHDLARNKRRSNMSYNSSNQRDSSNTESSIHEYNQPGSNGIGGGNESIGSNTVYSDSGDHNTQKHRERQRPQDIPRESNVSFNRSTSLTTSRRKNTMTPLTSIQQQPIENSNISEKMPSASLLSIRPKLSVSTGQTRKNTQPTNHQPLISSSPTQSPNTPSDYTFSRKKHESLSTMAGAFDPPSPYLINSRKIANAVIVENLTEANETILALLMEILIKKQVVDKSSVYNLSKPFIIVALLPITDSNSYDIPRQLLDRFFISYTYEGTFGPPSGGGRSPMNINRRNAIIKVDIEELSNRMDDVIVHSDMERYIRDVVVGIRTHRSVKGGITARSYLDFVTLIKALAAILQRHYATPELVLFASEKVFCHRLILRDVKDDKSIMYGTNITTLIKSISSKVLTSGDIVADVLQCVWPPV